MATYANKCNKGGKCNEVFFDGIIPLIDLEFSLKVRLLEPTVVVCLCGEWDSSLICVRVCVRVRVCVFASVRICSRHSTHSTHSTHSSHSSHSKSSKSS